MTWIWLGFLVLVTVLVTVDLSLHRTARTIPLREALCWTGLWVSLGLGFSIIIYFVYDREWLGATLDPEGRELVTGGRAVVEYLTAYLVEESLSVDNVFVFSVIFTSFSVPARYQHRVLFWGILGAVVFRGVMIVGGVWLINRFAWLFYVFGAYLAFSGIKFLRTFADDEDLESKFTVRLLKKFLPLSANDHGRAFIARENGRLVFTRLAIALIVVETTDIIFALDSIPAVLAISTEPFIIVSSNVFAILGLRSLYFVLADMMTRFRHLKKALAALLIFIGLKMLLHDVVHVHNLVSLGIVLLIVSAGVLTSLVGAEKSGD